jgi:protein-S-isoprenylcysteine O-methyltransferase Ste14
MSVSDVQSDIRKTRINLLRAVFLLSLPLVLFSRSAWFERHWLFELLEVAGVTLVITAVLGRFWSILYIGGRKNSTIMQDGPYSMCRHPLYFFSTLGVIGFGLMLGSLVLTAVLGAVSFLILSATAAREETALRDLFGPAYDEYATRVPRILPRLSLFRTEGEVTFKVAELRRNLMDALVFLTFIPLAELMEILKEYAVFPTFPLF